VNKLYII